MTTGEAAGALTYSGAMETAVSIRLLFFGPLRENAGSRGATREVPAGTSVGGLLEIVRTEYGVPERILSAVAVAVNQEYAERARVLTDGDEVAILPPVSGGSLCV